MHQQTLARVSLLAVVAAAIAAFFALDLAQYFNLSTLQAQRDTLATFTEQNKLLVTSLFMGAYVLMAALSIPGAAILTLAAGALFGVVLGTVVVSFASSIGATLAFLAARFLFKDAIQKRFARRLAAINQGIERDGAFYLLALRLVPAFPFWVINLVMALTPIKTATFYWVSQLGMLPATLVYVNAGTQLAEIETTSDILSPGLIGAFVLLGLMPLILRKLTQWFQARKVFKPFTKPKRFDYNLLVIGGGAAGLVSAYIGATVRAKVGLIEKHKMGGDCLNTGCVPSKALIRTSRLVAEARDSERYGIARLSPEVDFQQVMARVRRVIEKIEPHDSPERYRGLGVDVIEGKARLRSPWEVEVNDRILTARAIVLATGAEPLVPQLPGLEESGYLTSDTLWDLDTLPKRLVILGGGPIGCELAQAFARLDSAVTIVEMSDRLLPREDADASELLEQHFAHAGIHTATRCKAVRVDHGSQLVCERGGEELCLEFDQLLIALGRKARISGFGLEEIGVRINDQGLIDADGLQSTNFPNLYVCGDAAGPYQFTHVAAHQAWTAAVNALIRPFWSFQTDYRVIPWVTFTDPEVARVGLNEQEAQAKGVAFEVTRYGLDDLDRAIAEGEDYGFVKVLTEPGRDRILGATLVGSRAGEMLPEFVLAMKHGLGLNKLLGTIHVYPTWSEGNKYAAGAWKKAHAPETALAWAERFFRWRRH